MTGWRSLVRTQSESSHGVRRWYYSVWRLFLCVDINGDLGVRVAVLLTDKVAVLMFGDIIERSDQIDGHSKRETR